MKRILITAGATRERIDSVRFITNVSTGSTGAELASRFSAIGHEVFLLTGEAGVLPENPKCEVLRYSDFSDLNEKLTGLLATREWDFVFHAAAVSDYSVDSLQVGERTGKPDAGSKLDSSDEMILHLRRNPKIVDQIRNRSKNPQIRVVAFKLTDTRSEGLQRKAIQTLMDRARPDYVVHNDLSALSEGAARDFNVYTKTDARAVTGVADLADFFTGELKK